MTARMTVPATVQKVMRRIIACGGQPFVVGGAVRDAVMGIEPKDHDIEIFGMSIAQIVECVGVFGTPNTIGRAFGIVKVVVDGEEFDISVPRRENRIGFDHRDFEIDMDPTMTPREAARRRDFTMNCMFADVDGVITDPFNGRADIADGVIRMIDARTFVEDANRTIRAFQFAARFDFVIEPETAAVIARMVEHARNHIPAEVMFGEMAKIAIKGVTPSRAFRAMKETGFIRIFPQIANMVGCEQDEEHHPEGDVFEHTMHVVDAMARIVRRDNVQGIDRMVAIFGAICHDMGKPSTTARNEAGRITAHGHDEAGVPVARSFMAQICAPNEVTARVAAVTKHHMAHIRVRPEAKIVRRMAVRFQPSSMEEVSRVMEADHSGRPPKAPGNPFAPFMEIAAQIDVTNRPPRAIVDGRVIMETFGVNGPEVGRIKNAIFQAQIDGIVTTVEEGIRFARETGVV